MKNFFSKLFDKGVSSDSFDSEISKLWMIPERNWYDGRKTPCNTLIKNAGTDIKNKRLPLGPNNYLSVLKFNIDKGEYLYFEQVIETSAQPIIEWFQLEKIDRSYGPHIYRTKLLLSSDNQAKTQGSGLILLFEK